MKIAFVISKLNYSGAEKIARHLITAMNKEKYEIGLILLASETMYPEFDYAKQFLIKINGGRVTRIVNRLKQIRKIIVSEKYDVVLSFGAISNVNVLAALRGIKIPVIVCERNDPAYDPPEQLYRIGRKILYCKASGYVFQTDRIANYFSKAISKQAVVIPNFIEEAYENLYKKDQGNNLVITARLDDNQKNISMLLRVFKRFNQDRNYCLYIVGDGPDESKFKAYTKENNLEDSVIFTGRQDVKEYLKIAKIFVLTSHFEGMPNSLIEALASGLPCISTDCGGGGAAYLIQDHVNGLLVPENDEDAFLAGLEEMVSAENLLANFSEEAYKINERLEYSKIINMWLEYIQRVAEGKNLN